jgi:hypothetical protein
MATISFKVQSQINIKDQFNAGVYIDTGDSSINAISGTINFSPGISVERIEEGSSLVSLWIESPKLSPDGRSITFSGIVPGGFHGSHELLNIVVSATASSKQSINASNMEIRANDASASLVPVTVKALNVNISSVVGTSTVSVNDTISPEPFTLAIGKDPSLFDNHPFVSFATQDKQSGIDHYEVAFSHFPVLSSQNKYSVATSPYEIAEKYNGDIVHIKAVDQAGNIRIEKIPTPGFYPRMILYSIIVVLIIWALSVFIRKFGRSKPPLQ